MDAGSDPLPAAAVPIDPQFLFEPQSDFCFDRLVPQLLPLPELTDIPAFQSVRSDVNGDRYLLTPTDAEQGQRVVKYDRSWREIWSTDSFEDDNGNRLIVSAIALEPGSRDIVVLADRIDGETGTSWFFKLDVDGERVWASSREAALAYTTCDTSGEPAGALGVNAAGAWRALTRSGELLSLEATTGQTTLLASHERCPESDRLAVDASGATFNLARLIEDEGELTKSAKDGAGAGLSGLYPVGAYPTEYLVVPGAPYIDDSGEALVVGHGHGLARLDVRDGTPLWSRRFAPYTDIRVVDRPANEVYSSITTIPISGIVMNDTSLVATGPINLSPGTSSEFSMSGRFVGKFGYAGSADWVRVYALPEGTDTALLEDPDGGFDLVWNETLVGKSMRLDAEGRPLGYQVPAEFLEPAAVEWSPPSGQVGAAWEDAKRVAEQIASEGATGTLRSSAWGMLWWINAGYLNGSWSAVTIFGETEEQRIELGISGLVEVPDEFFASDMIVHDDRLYVAGTRSGEKVLEIYDRAGSRLNSTLSNGQGQLGLDRNGDIAELYASSNLAFENERGRVSVDALGGVSQLVDGQAEWMTLEPEFLPCSRPSVRAWGGMTTLGTSCEQGAVWKFERLNNLGQIDRKLTLRSERITSSVATDAGVYVLGSVSPEVSVVAHMDWRGNTVWAKHIANRPAVTETELYDQPFTASTTLGQVEVDEQGRVYVSAFYEWALSPYGWGEGDTMLLVLESETGDVL